MKPAIFLDRDGVINENRSDYVKSWDEFVFLPGVFGALHKLRHLGWLVVVLSNQSPIGRGILTAEEVDLIHERMAAAIGEQGGQIDLILYCPHHPDAGCGCRKPQPGLLYQAAQKLDIDLGASYFIGDAESDVYAALAAGCHPILVKTGRGEAHWLRLQEKKEDRFVVKEDLAQAVEYILRQVSDS